MSKSRNDFKFGCKVSRFIGASLDVIVSCFETTLLFCEFESDLFIDMGELGHRHFVVPVQVAGPVGDRGHLFEMDVSSPPFVQTWPAVVMKDRIF